MSQRVKFTNGIEFATGVACTEGLTGAWQRIETGGGSVNVVNGILQLEKQNAATDVYANAQIDDYQQRRRRDFLWRPPLSFSIHARFSHNRFTLDPASTTTQTNYLTGTAGFGFWNDPFMMTDSRRPAPPRAIWFFYSSPPSNMQLALDLPGDGWKAATIDAQRVPFFLLLPTAPIAIPLMHINQIYQLLWPVAQRAINVSEALIQQPMSEWHTYRIEWLPQTATFFIDDVLVLECNTPPRGPLGLVIWIDNQYMVVTPQGRIGHGLVKSGQIEKMEIEWFQIKNL